MRHPALDNRNGVVIGPSGSGKSFTCNVWITQQHEMGYDQVIVDVGGSYRSVVEALGGKYYELTPDTPMRMNIFGVPQNKEGDYYIDSDKSIYLRSLINVLWKDTTKGEDLDRNEDSVFTELLDLYVVHLNSSKAQVSNLISFVKFVADYIERKDLSDRWKKYLTMVKMDSFLLNMNKFTSGVYKDIVNSEANVDLSADRLICFDMQGIQKDPVIYPVMALVLVEQVFDKMKRDAVMPKALFMDEAWSFLGGSPVLAKFAENLARTVRKFNGSLIIITQGYSEIKNSRIGDAIRQNMAIKVILDHATQTAIIGDMSDWFGFTPLEQDLIRSIRKSETWREVFIKRQDMASVYVIDAGFHSVVAFSSKAEDRFAIQQAIAKYRRVDFAIDAIVESKLSA
jgi:type IV secretory pathway VirB4 component